MAPAPRLQVFVNAGVDEGEVSWAGAVSAENAPAACRGATVAPVLNGWITAPCQPDAPPALCAPPLPYSWDVKPKARFRALPPWSGWRASARCD
jgi:hypothetical protein